MSNEIILFISILENNNDEINNNSKGCENEHK